EVEGPRPDDRNGRRQGMGVDDRRNRICRVVKTIDELEAKGDQERHAQKQKGHPRRNPGVSPVHVLEEAIGRVQHPGRKKAAENDDGERINPPVQLRFGARWMTGARHRQFCHLLSPWVEGGKRRRMSGLHDSSVTCPPTLEWW